MFGFNPPALKEFIYIPLSAVLLVWALVSYFPSEYAGFIVAATCINCAFVPSVFLIRQFVEWEQNKDEPMKNPKVKEYLDMNKVTGNVFSQATDTVKINAVMQFNKTLIEQHQGKMDVNLTEAFWLNKQPGADESRWTKAGGVGRADFIEFIERGILWQAYKKSGGQGKRVPNNWRKIAQLAQGYPLPTFEQLPKQ